MKYLRSKNKIKRINLEYNKFYNYANKHIVYNNKVDKKVRFKIMLNLQKKKNYFYKNLINNMSLDDYKSNSVSRLFKSSRYNAKIELSNGFANGFRKAS